MRLASIERGGRVLVALVTDRGIVDVAAAQPALDRRIGDFNSVLDVIDGGLDVWSRFEDFAADAEAAITPSGEGVWWYQTDSVKFVLPYVPRKDVFAVAANYHEHLVAGYARFGREAVDPPHPEVFSKRLSSLVGDGEDVVYDKRATRALDHEVELAVIIGRGGRDIARENAHEHIFGYSVANDVSARDMNMRDSPQWFHGKSLDTFCPFGPYLVTPTDLPDPGRERLQFRMNGVLLQDWPVGDMIFPVDEIIAVLSEGMTLEPGDVIMCGTGPGVGFEPMPQRWLQHRDEIETSITGLGTLRNRVRMAGA